MKLADYVVTEAGFGADLGAEKFVDIKCRKSGLRPSAAVIVATVRALKYHGGVALADLGTENLDAVRAGFVNLERHIHNVSDVYGIRTVVGINKFGADTDAELELVRTLVEETGARAVIASHWGDGGAGAVTLAEAIVEVCEAPSEVQFVYPDEMGLLDKVRAIATRVYGAAEVSASSAILTRIAELEASGYGSFPVCIAKTQSSFSTDATLRGAPSGHTIAIREVRLSAGAEFIVMVCGDIMTMPGLPAKPASLTIDVIDGRIVGLA